MEKGKRNGKGKEYFGYDDKLKFEGEYLNGKRNGKGKEYYIDGKLKFEGEYLNGQKWNVKGYNKEGKIWNGKGYNKSGNVEFEIKKGKGEVQEYDYNGKIEYEGEYLNGERNGKCKEYFDNGRLAFEREYLNGKRNGKKYDNNGELLFDGEYLNGNRLIGIEEEYKHDLGSILLEKSLNGGLSPIIK